MFQFKILVIFYLLSDVTLQQEVNFNYVFSEIDYRIKVLRFLCDNKTFKIPSKLKEKSKCIFQIVWKIVSQWLHLPRWTCHFLARHGFNTDEILLKTVFKKNVFFKGFSTIYIYFFIYASAAKNFCVSHILCAVTNCS